MRIFPFEELSKEELVHILTEIIGVTEVFQKVKDCRKAQKFLEERSKTVCCWECRSIARKLGLEE